MNDLTVLSDTKRAVMHAHSVVDCNRLVKMAQAVQVVADTDEMRRRASELYLRARRRRGEIERGLPKRTGGDAMKARSDTATEVPPTLAEYGIDKREASVDYRLLDIPDEAFEEYVSTADDITTAGAIRLGNKERQKDNTTAPVPEGVFDVLYADPPWRYENSGFAMSAEQQYPTMDTKDICNYRDKDGREIHDAVADNAVLFLWVTNPLLLDGIKVMDAWGFDYKTNAVWVKKNHTAGFYVFGQHELLLIGTRGTGMVPEWKPKSIIEGENTVHSRKPDVVYALIEHMYPGRKYLELFSRRSRDGWEAVRNGI